MLERVTRRVFIPVAIATLLLLACAVDEDLRIHGDGSGTYRVRITVPKELSSDFTDLRKSAEKTGFQIVEEGETQKERFLVLHKDFTDIATINDSTSRFELTMTEAGFLRREYRLRASLGSIGYGSFKRRFTVSMPGKVASTTSGEIDGSRVKWEGSNGGSLEIVSSGFYLPLTRGQNNAVMMLLVVGLVVVIFGRLRRRQPAASNPATGI